MGIFRVSRTIRVFGYLGSTGNTPSWMHDVLGLFVSNDLDSLLLILFPNPQIMPGEPLGNLAELGKMHRAFS